jgi:hypothetical protein
MAALLIGPTTKTKTTSTTRGRFAKRFDLLQDFYLLKTK